MRSMDTTEHRRAAVWAAAQLGTLDGVISYMEATAEESWRVKTVRSSDGSTNCFFGHLFNMGANDAEGSALWDLFEDLWATTYLIYPINDGENSDYPQPTPKQRVLTFLHDLRDGRVLNTQQSMEACYAHSLACAEQGSGPGGAVAAAAA